MRRVKNIIFMIALIIVLLAVLTPLNLRLYSAIGIGLLVISLLLPHKNRKNDM